MPKFLPRVVVNAHNFDALNTLLSENFTAANAALAERVVGHRVSVTRYAATGATTTKIRLGSRSPLGATPWGVLLVRASESSDPGKDLSVASRLNFSWDGATQTLLVYEPQGLASNTFYDLDFLVLE